MVNETENRDWLANLDLEDEGLKADPTLNKYKSLEDAFKGHVEAAGRHGRSITIPTAEAGEDQWGEFTDSLVNKVNEGTTRKLMYVPDSTDDEGMANFYAAMGVPEDATGYENPEGITLEDNTLERTRDMAHKAKLTPTQHKDVLEWLSKESVEVQELAQQMQADDDNKLGNAWGASTDDRKKRVDSVLRGEGLSVEHMNAEHYLAYDMLISKLQGQGPQGDSISNVQVGPTKAELKERAQDITRRLVDEGRAMGAEKYRNLQQKLLDTHDAIALIE